MEKLDSRIINRINHAEVKIQRGIFPEDLLLPLLFVITMMSLMYILR